MIIVRLDEIEKTELLELSKEKIVIVKSKSIFGSENLIEFVIGPGVPITLFVISYILNKKKDKKLRELIIKNQNYLLKSNAEIIKALEAHNS